MRLRAKDVPLAERGRHRLSRSILGLQGLEWPSRRILSNLPRHNSDLSLIERRSSKQRCPSLLPHGSVYHSGPLSVWRYCEAGDVDTVGIPLRIEGAVSRNRQSPTTIGATQSKTTGPVRRRRPTIQAFQPIFEVAKTWAESGVVLINEPPLANSEPKAAYLCFWWRLSRGEPHLLKTFRRSRYPPVSGDQL